MRIQVGDIGIEYELEGPETGSAIVLHHSLATSHCLWEDQAIALAQNDRVLRFDARGHGQTDATPGPYNFEQLAGDVIGLMDALGIERAHHVGLSMGGMVCQVLGYTYPERVRSLTLVSTTSNLPKSARAAWDQRLADVAADGMEPQVEPTLKRWFTADFREDCEECHEQLERIGDMIRQTPVEGYRGWGAAIRDLDLTAKLAKVTAPTLVMVGNQDPGTPVAMAEEIYKAIPEAALQVLPDVSHMLVLQDPDAFLETLMDFLEEVEEDEEDAAAEV